MSFFNKAKKYVKEEWEHKQAVNKARTTARREAELKEATKYEEKKAVHKYNEKLKAAKKPRSYGFQGFAGPSMKNPTQSLGVNDYLLGKPTKKRKGGNNFNL